MVKQAVTPEEQARLNREAWQQMLAVGLTGLGVGAGSRSLMAIRDMFRAPPSVDDMASVPTSIPVYIPEEKQKEDKTKANKKQLHKVGALLKESLFGDARDGVNWWQIPVGLGLASGGTWAGWKAVDKLMANHKNSREEAELEDARKEYEAAIRNAMQWHVKHSDVRSDLDTLYDGCCELDQQLIKTAAGRSLWAYGGDALHLGGGTLATLMALAALGTGAGTYSWMRSLSNQKVMEEAIKQRRQSRTQPMPVYAYPVPISTSPAKQKIDEPEE